MPEMNIIQAVNDCLRVEMRRDSRVVVLGEDVGRFGGVFRATVGLQEEFGPDRCIDTPLAENGIVGCAIGMALYGLRPVAEIQFADYVYPAYDQIVNELAKMRYRSGGEYQAPVVVRMPAGGGIKGGHYHSQSPEAIFIHTPGSRSCTRPTRRTPRACWPRPFAATIPVIFMEPKRHYRTARGEVPEGEYLVPIGKAAVLHEASGRSARSVTILAWGAMVHTALEAVEKASARATTSSLSICARCCLSTSRPFSPR
jgi:pyruvate dehydrogenase E1 component beta subunit